MFTGIIETTAAIGSVEKSGSITRLTIERPREWELREGQSIAVHGACLTVVSFDETSFRVELMPETLERSSFSTEMPQHVNLERAMPADGRFEGHIVQGHIDTVGTVVELTESGETARLQISIDPANRAHVVPKGSITIDGVSLTVASLEDGSFSVALIPHTLSVTTLGVLKKGQAVNLEFDIIGKYIQRMRPQHLSR